MLEKFLNEYVSIVAGSGAEKVVVVLFKKKNVNEFLIAKKLNLTINQTRNILYKLADSGLVHFMRKKDLKSGGWYTYFWTLDERKCLINYKTSILKDIESQEELLMSRKTKQFYVCNTCGIEVSDEQALINEFTCTECGEVYSLKDSAESIKEVEKVIQKMRDKLNLIQIEIDKFVVEEPKVDKKTKSKKDKKAKAKTAKNVKTPKKTKTTKKPKKGKK